MPLSRNIVLLVCAGVVTITSIGTHSFSLFLRLIEAELGWSRTTATVTVSSQPIAAAAPSMSEART